MAILAEHYRETLTRLVADPVVRGMASDIAEGLQAGYVTLDDLVHASTLTPRFGFMQNCNERYRSLTTDDSQPRHLGAVADAVIDILTKEAV